MNAQLIKGNYIPIGISNELLDALGYSNSYSPFHDWDGGYICADRESLDMSYNYMIKMYETGYFPTYEGGATLEELIVEFTILYENLDHEDLIKVLVE